MDHAEIEKYGEYEVKEYCLAVRAGVSDEHLAVLAKLADKGNDSMEQYRIAVEDEMSDEHLDALAKLADEGLGEMQQYRWAVENEMSDDFNTPAAIGQLFNFSREINSRLGQELSKASIQALYDTFVDFADNVLGILPKEKSEGMSADPFIDLLVEVLDQVKIILYNSPSRRAQFNLQHFS